MLDYSRGCSRVSQLNLLSGVSVWCDQSIRLGMQTCRTSSTRCPLRLGQRVTTQGYEPIDRSRTHNST